MKRHLFEIIVGGCFVLFAIVMIAATAYKGYTTEKLEFCSTEDPVIEKKLRNGWSLVEWKSTERVTCLKKTVPK